MAPTPDESSTSCGITNADVPISGNSVVITGMSALMPSCHGLDDFEEKLYNMENLVTGEKSRWKFNHPEMSRYHGIVPDIETFDAQFFMIHYRLSQSTDATCRKLLEQSYQAIIDAGVCPTELSGKRVGVFVATGINDMHRMFTLKAHGTELLGSIKTMAANRISYWLNTKGPSYTLDASCCGSLVALEKACDALSHGDCDAAIVGAARISYNPLTSLHYRRMVPLNNDGKTKCYDMNADGLTMSEAVISLFVQKYKDARRVYAEIYHIKSNYSDGLIEDQFGPYRDPAKLAKFLQDFYKEAEVLPSAVEYVEGHGTASVEVDKAELQAIEQVFCRNRCKSLLVGSVTSNMGFADTTSGLCGIVKLLLAYKRGQIAANLHCENPRLDIAALQDNRMRIVTKHEQFDRSFTALNNFSVTGVTAHLLLKGCFKNKDMERYHCEIPRLVTVSGRQETAVKKILDSIKDIELDPEEIALYHEIHKKRIQKHMARGYGIYATENKKTVAYSEKLSYNEHARRPLWFVYSGMGSQWTGMGTQLMRIPIFAAAIERCANVLKPKGVDVVKIITSPDEKIFDNILNSFVGISAIQIGLTDILHAVGLVPNYMIGHSVGELGCAYADGCCTTEDIMLLSYNRGLISTRMSFIKGAMAAVGVGYRQISNICPSDIDVACHNGPDSSTISGPVESVREFVSQLTSRGIFVKEVNCSNIPYHSRYVAKAGLELLRYTKEIIKEPKLRSERWLSTSVPLVRWHENSAKYSSAEYHTNNLASPVLFEETCRLVQSDAVLVEVAPHGLLQAILKRSLPPDCRHVPLTMRGHKDNALFLLEALGALYMEGYDLDISTLYPTVDFPVSTQTRQLSHLVEWVHTEKWNVNLYMATEREFTAVYKPIVTIYDEEYKYLKGSIVGDNCVFPLSRALVFVWDTLSMITKRPLRETTVQFHKVKYYKQLVLRDNKALPLMVMMHRCSGKFEVTHKDSLVVEGFIFAVTTNNNKKYSDLKESNYKTLNSSDIYKLLFERGYKYKHEFRAIYSSNLSLTNAQLIWQENWVTFIDGVLQLCTLKNGYGSISLPQYINRICIDIQSHQYALNNVSNDKNHMLIGATLFENQTTVRCGGVSIENIIFKDKPLLKKPVTLKKLIYKTSYHDGVGDNTCGGEHYIPQKQNYTSRPATLQCSGMGDLNSLYWEKIPDMNHPAGDIKIEVHYAELNVYDAQRALARIPVQNTQDQGFGIGFSGIITESGTHVMGLRIAGGVNQQIWSRPEYLWPIPTHWSLEDAATVPLAYAIAFYLLTIKGKLVPGATLLIHGGAGALGQAAISIAIGNGCEVFTTVGDHHKKTFLTKLFPNLPVDHIGNSRDHTFRDMIINMTKGKGCDIILSCDKESLKHVTLGCCAAEGTTFDIIQIHTQENFEFGMFNMTKSRSYVTLDVSSIFHNHNINEFKKIRLMISEGICHGYVRPLSRMTYAPYDAARAFRLLAASRHRGRVLLRMQETLPQVQKRLTFAPDACHVIMCDKDEFGIYLAHRLADLGVKKLFITVPEKSKYLSIKKQLWKKLGVKVRVVCNTLGSTKNFQELFNEGNSLGTIEAIFVIATDDMDMDTKDKVNSDILHINTLSRKRCPRLRYFAVLHEDDSIGRDVCQMRNQNGLNSLSLQIHLQKFAGLELKNENEEIMWCSAVDVVITALLSKEVFVCALSQSFKPPDLLEEVANISGINITTSTDERTPLQQVGLDEEHAQEVCTLLEEKFDINVPRDMVPFMTVGQLKNLKVETIELDKEVPGFGGYFSYIDSDEMLASCELIYMPTLTHPSNLKPNEYEDNEKYLCIVPGMEGHHERFRGMCKLLKLPVVVLQLGLDEHKENLQEIAQRLVNVLMYKLKMKNQYYLLGYEFGVPIVIEMATILDSYGLTGTVYCVGGTPNDIRSVLENKLQGMTEEMVQDALVKHYHYLLFGEKSAELDHNLRNWTQYSDKIKFFVQKVRGRIPHSSQYVQKLLEVAYSRVKLMSHCRTEFKDLKAKIVILRAKLPKGIPVCSQNSLHRGILIIDELEVFLEHVPQDLKCAALINRYLDSEILKKFYNTNRCESYTKAEDVL